MIKEEILYLSDLCIGEVGIIVRLEETDIKVKRHLLDMGLTKNTKITIKRIAPMGDPFDIYLRGYELCINKNNLNKIRVKRI